MNRPVQLGSFKFSTVLLILLNTHIKVVPFNSNECIKKIYTIRFSNQVVTFLQICLYILHDFFLCRLLINKNKTLETVSFSFLCTLNFILSSLFALVLKEVSNVDLYTSIKV